jgi:hypothetical protein
MTNNLNNNARVRGFDWRTWRVMVRDAGVAGFVALARHRGKRGGICVYCN